MESVPVEEATAGCEIYQCQEEILNNGTHTNCKSVISLVNYQPFKIFACDVNIWKGHVGKTIDGQGKFKVIKGFWAMFSCFPCDVQIRLSQILQNHVECFADQKRLLRLCTVHKSTQTISGTWIYENYLHHQTLDGLIRRRNRNGCV